jgi:hypothetical protein
MNSNSPDAPVNLDSLAEVREWEEDFRVVVHFDHASDAFIVSGADDGFRFTAHSLDEAEAKIRAEVVSWEWGDEVIGKVDEGPDRDAMIEKIQIDACRIAVEKLHAAWADCEKAKL